MSADPKWQNFRRHREADDTIVILQSRKEKSSFMTSVKPTDFVSDLTRLADGTLAYDILGYAKDVKDGQLYLYGRTF